MFRHRYPHFFLSTECEYLCHLGVKLNQNGRNQVSHFFLTVNQEPQMPSGVWRSNRDISLKSWSALKSITSHLLWSFKLLLSMMTGTSLSWRLKNSELADDTRIHCSASGDLHANMSSRHHCLLRNIFCCADLKDLVMVVVFCCRSFKAVEERF